MRLLLGLVTLLVVASSVYGLRVADADLWGHLAAGRLFVERREVPTRDPFSYAAADRDWVAHEYLSEIVLWCAYSFAGALGLIAVKCALGATTVWFVYRSIRVSTDDPRIWAPILMLAGCLLRPYLYARPQLFTFAFFALFVFVLSKLLVRGGSRLWPLVGCLVVWANLHGGFLAGLGVLGLALAASAVRSFSRETLALAATLAAGLVASLVTPFGYKLWSSIGTDLTNPDSTRFIAEWQPLPLLPPDWTSALAIFFFALVTIAALGTARRGACPAGFHPWILWLGVCPLAWMALSHHRHVPLFAIFASPVLGLLGSAAVEWRGASRTREAAILVVTLLIGLAGAAQLLDTLRDPLPRIHRIARRPGLADPAGAVAFARANALGGNVYTPLWWGSYVTWELYPRVRVSCDGRHDMLYSVEQIGENLRFYATRQPDLEAPLRWASDFVLAPARAAVTPRLRNDTRWQLLYADAEAVLFVRADEPHRDLVRRSREGSLRASHQAPAEFLP